ncbi:MAG: T9SS type A sorting domain-containing protein, partial [Ignavibacteriales bacterium]
SAEDFVLYQNYPNPFNPSTTISWQSPVSSRLTLKVFDVLGNEVATLIDEYNLAGRYEIEFRPESSIKNLSSGVYFYQLKIGNYIETRKMILMK